MEVTDDKTLPAAERKRLQIVNAPHKSLRAKYVKLADKLYNLRDLERNTPVGWTEARVQQYFEWASKVVAGLRGTSKVLEDKLDVIFARHGVLTSK
jgi:(p)ppGpp synthase/HD superfamily hydrolase